MSATGRSANLLVAQAVGGRNRGLGGAALGLCNLGIGIDIGLLIDPHDALQRPDIERILRVQIGLKRDGIFARLRK